MINPIARAALAILTALTVGCQHTSQLRTSPESTSPAQLATQPDTPLAAPEQMMLKSITTLLSQIFKPEETTVQVTQSNTDPATQTVVEQLLEAGFGIQRVPTDQGATFLRVARDNSTRAGVFSALRYEVSLGRVTVSRAFERQRSKATPASVVTILGTRIPLQLDDTMFGPEANEGFARIAYGGSLTETDSPIISLITPEIVDRVATRSAKDATPGTQLPSVQALNTHRVQVGNLFYQEESNFGSFLDSHERINRTIVVFANDSMNLGRNNKRRVAELAGEFNETYDVINLVGCSNGPTALDIGNEGLALGRAKRVAEELTILGVPEHLIIDEGCWAPVSAENFPGRGVVMELWRATL